MISIIQASSKRLWLGFVLAAQIAASLPSGQLIGRWAVHWWTNRARILTLTSINTGLATTSEAIIRSGYMAIGSNNEYYRFVVPRKNGGYKINRQSLTNILMTLFASLLGGPVFFFASLRSRFLFFICFGTMNSYLSQVFGSLLRDGVVHIMAQRLYFDMIYNATLKFFMFESFRRPIARRDTSLLSLGGIRIGQEFSLTYLRVALLNLCGFRG